MYWTHVGIIIISAQSQSVRITPLVVHVCSSEKAAQLIRIVRSYTLFGKFVPLLCSRCCVPEKESFTMLMSSSSSLCWWYFVLWLVVVAVKVGGGGGGGDSSGNGGTSSGGDGKGNGDGSGGDGGGYVRRGKLDLCYGVQCTRNRPVCAIKLQRRPARSRCIATSVFCKHPVYTYIEASGDSEQYFSFEKWAVFFVARLEMFNRPQYMVWKPYTTFSYGFTLYVKDNVGTIVLLLSRDKQHCAILHIGNYTTPTTTPSQTSSSIPSTFTITIFSRSSTLFSSTSRLSSQSQSTSIIIATTIIPTTPTSRPTTSTTSSKTTTLAITVSIVVSIFAGALIYMYVRFRMRRQGAINVTHDVPNEQVTINEPLLAPPRTAPTAGDVSVLSLSTSLPFRPIECSSPLQVTSDGSNMENTGQWEDISLDDVADNNTTTTTTVSSCAEERVGLPLTPRRYPSRNRNKPNWYKAT